MNSKHFLAVITVSIVLQSPVMATEPTVDEHNPPSSNTSVPAGKFSDEATRLFCHIRTSGGIQSNVTLRVDYKKNTVNERPALISPFDIRWTRLNSKGRNTLYKLNRASGLLEGGIAGSPTQVTGVCQQIPNQ